MHVMTQNFIYFKLKQNKAYHQDLLLYNTD